MISWIRIQISINLQMKSQNVGNTSLFEHFFKGLSLYLEARIQIHIRITASEWKVWSESAPNENKDQDSHQGDAERQMISALGVVSKISFSSELSKILLLYFIISFPFLSIRYRKKEGYFVRPCRCCRATQRWGWESWAPPRGSGRWRRSPQSWLGSPRLLNN